jgi:hypothetical protein
MSSEIRPLDILRAKRCHLDEWWEIVGVLLGTRMSGYEYEVYVECREKLYKLVYHADSREAGILSKKLRGLEGRVIGILRTDLVDEPVAVRVED